MDPSAVDSSSSSAPSKPKVPRFGVPMGGFALPILPIHKQRAPSIDPGADQQQQPPVSSSENAMASPSSQPPPLPSTATAASSPPPTGQYTNVPGGRAGAPPPLPRTAAAPPPLPATAAASPPSQSPPTQTRTIPPPMPKTAASNATNIASAPPPLPTTSQTSQPPRAHVSATSTTASSQPPPSSTHSTSTASTPPMPPPPTPQEQEFARSTLNFLLEELSPSVFTRKKDALDTFEAYYFKIFPTYSPSEVRSLYFGCTPSHPHERAKGLLALCGMTSWKHSGLKKAASQAMGLLAKLCDAEASPHAQIFAQTYVNLDPTTLRMLRFEKHLTSPRGNRHGANFLLNLLKVYKYDTYESVQRELTQQAPEEAVHLKNMKRDHLAKRISLRSSDASILKKKAAYGGGNGNGNGNAAPNSNDAKSNDAKSKEKSSIKNRLLAFFGGRPSAAELEKKGLIRSKSFAVALEDLYRNPTLLQRVATAFNGEVDVPLVLALCCQHMLDAGIIQLQGVFRLSGDSIEIGGIKDKLDVGAVVDLTRVGPHSVSGLVKLFLRQLPQPLFMFENYDALVGAYRANDFNKIDHIIGALPRSHAQTYTYLMDFLSRVNSYHETNMMTDTNIAICIAPNVLRPKVETYEKVAKDTPITIGVVKYLISSHAEKMRQAGLLGGAPTAAAAPTPVVVAAAVPPSSSSSSSSSSPVRTGRTINSAGASAGAGDRAVSPARFAISPPISPRGGKNVLLEYSSTSAEAIAAQREADARAAQELDENGQPIEVTPKPFVPTTAQFDLANAMASAMANRSALKPTRPPTTTASSSSSASSGAPSPAFVPLKKVGPPQIGAGAGAGSATNSPPAIPQVNLKKVEGSVLPPAAASTTSAATPVVPPAVSSSSSSNITVKPPPKRSSMIHTSTSASAASKDHSIPEHFQRFSDPKTGQYYYFNRFTQKVTWRKPDTIVDALDESDVKQVFPPPPPTEPPPQDDESDTEDGVSGVLAPITPTSASRPSVSSSHHSTSHSSVASEVAAFLPAIVPAPPKQPRRTSAMFGHALLPPPPKPFEPTRSDSSESEAEEIDSDDDIPVPTSAPPPIPTTLPPPFDDGDDDDVPMDALPPSVDAPVLAPVPIPAEATAQTTAEDEDDIPLPPAPVPATQPPAPTSENPSVVVPPQPVDDDADVIEDDEWEQYTDAITGKTYYYNKVKDITTWSNPFKNTPSSSDGAIDQPSAGSVSDVSLSSSSSAVASTSVPPSQAPTGRPSVPSTLLHSSSSFPSPLYGGWDAIEMRGEWTSASAQGCYPNFAGWSRNPQYHIGVAPSNDGEEVKGKTQVVIQLEWNRLSRVNGFTDGDSSSHSIAGFYVLINHGPSYQKLFINADEIVSRSEFEKDGSVSVNLLLDSFSQNRPGKVGAPFVKNYILIPSTFEPGYLGEFTITLHSASKTWIQPVSDEERWLETAVTSQWLGDTAGGCRNHAATFPLNPQFSLTSLTPSPTSTPVLILLTQHLPTPHSQIHPIGFYAINAQGKIEAKGAFQANVEVHTQFDLQSTSGGSYVLVPCTFSPGLESKFTLAVFAPKNVKLQLKPIPRG